MIEWEYVVRTFLNRDGDAMLTSLLDEQGRQGWELVAFDFDRCRAVFKRRKDDLSEFDLPF